MLWSAKNRCFFLPTKGALSLDPDAILIDREIFNEYSGIAPDGKIRIVGEDSMPAWGDAPAPTQEEVIIINESEKNRRLAEAAAAIAPLQDAVDLSMATKKEVAALTEWKKYRVLLSRITPDDAPKIDWPPKPE